jgi:hypothetical protein
LPSKPGSGSFATLTHARLRAAQGDVSGAVRILRVIVGAEPTHDEARRLLDELQGRPNRAAVEPEAPPLAERAAARASELAGRFRETIGGVAPPDAGTRRERLSRWLVRAVALRGERHVR